MNTPKKTKTNARHPIPIPAFAPVERLGKFGFIGELRLAVGLEVVDIFGGLEEVFGMFVDSIEDDKDVGAGLVEAASLTIEKRGLVRLVVWLDTMKRNWTSDIMASFETRSA